MTKEPFRLSPLPYAETSLEPAISARTIGFHYHKHHKSYVETLNTLVQGSRYADMKLEGIVRATEGKEGKEHSIFDNAAQVWNHDFYWRSLSPKPVKPEGPLANAIKRDFGGLEKLTQALAEAGKTQFGSGWAWLISKGGKLSVQKTPDAQNPMAHGINCLLAIDVWEHAYYLDYQNERASYLESVLARLLNWDFAAENLTKEDHAVRAAAE